MPHKQKVVAEEKTRIVRECLAGRMGQSKAARLLQVAKETLINSASLR